MLQVRMPLAIEQASLSSVQAMPAGSVSLIVTS